LESVEQGEGQALDPQPSCGEGQSLPAWPKKLGFGAVAAVLP
jgi:hypothetical protein